MLGRISHWISDKLESSRSDDYHLRYESLYRLRKETLSAIHVAKELAYKNEEQARDEASTSFLTSENQITHRLGMAIEAILMLGLKRHGQQEISLWSVLYAASMAVDDPVLLQTTLSAAVLSESDEGKARAWLKMALNSHTLGPSIRALASSKDVLPTSYEHWSILRNSDSSTSFLQMLSEIDKLNFFLEVDDTPFEIEENATDDADYMHSLHTPQRRKNRTASGVSESSDRSTPSSYVHVRAHSDGRLVHQSVFGLPLAQVTSDPVHSTYATIDPCLSVPKVVCDCCDVLEAKAPTPRLLRSTVVHPRLEELERIYTKESRLPDDTTAHEAAALLLHFLRSFPEPLLPLHTHEAFVKAGRNRDREDGVSAITELVNSLPVSPKVVLERIVSTFGVLLTPENAERAGINGEVAASMLAPAVVFHPDATQATGDHRRVNQDYQNARFAAVYEEFLQMMIEHQEVVFKKLRSQIEDAREQVETMERRLSSFYNLTNTPVRLDAPADVEQLEYLSRQFLLEEETETMSELHLENEKVVEAWQRYGFGASQITQNFSDGGVLLLRAVSYLVDNDVRARTRWKRWFASAIEETSSDSAFVELHLSSILLDALHLRHPDSERIDIVTLSKEPFWSLLANDEDAFLKLFVFIHEVLDDYWTTSVSLSTALERSESAVRQLLMSTSFEFVAEMAEAWHHEQDDKPPEEDDSDSDSDTASVPQDTMELDEYKDKLLHASRLLDLHQVAAIDRILPLTCQLCKWHLLYSTDLHGSSLHSLLAMANGHSPTLVVIKTDAGDVLGGFATEPWGPRAQYYGNGECLVFSLDDTNENAAKYAWTRMNDYFMLCSDQSLAMGGGGDFALFLDSDLARGSSGACETFGNPPLASSPDFACVQVEVWGFTMEDKAPARPRMPRKSVLD